MKEWTVLSGKGGCGKTTLTASFARLMKGGVLADCDVDAADMSLLMKGEDRKQEDFYSGFTAVIDSALCSSCGRCDELCRFQAVLPPEDGKGFRIDPLRCEGCGVCRDNCPAEAVTLKDRLTGQWFIRETTDGPLVHARLGAGGENSGRLVTHVRDRARELAKERGEEKILTDGPPGIGCPVIASLNGVDQVLVVTEPTPSGIHDLERVIRLLKHFGIPASVCVNKADLSGKGRDEIRELADRKGLRYLGEIPWDKRVTDALRAGITPLEAGIGPVSEAIQKIWEKWNE